MSQLILRGSPIGSVKCVLFDKDGTLSNSEQYLLKLCQFRIEEAISIFQAKNASPKKILKLQSLMSLAYGMTPQGISPNGLIAIGSREQNIISTATVLSLVGENWSKAFDIANTIFSTVDNLNNKVCEDLIARPLLPGVINVLEKFKKAGIMCALISNDTTAGIKSFLQNHKLDEFFQTYWSSDNQPSKPNPDAVKGLCKKINLEPSECALVGDSDSDLLMARKAGIRICIGYTSGWSQSPQLTQQQELIHHWDELNIQQNTKVPVNIGAI